MAMPLFGGGAGGAGGITVGGSGGGGAVAAPAAESDGPHGHYPAVVGSDMPAELLPGVALHRFATSTSSTTSGSVIPAPHQQLPHTHMHHDAAGQPQQGPAAVTTAAAASGALGGLGAVASHPLETWALSSLDDAEASSFMLATPGATSTTTSAILGAAAAAASQPQSQSQSQSQSQLAQSLARVQPPLQVLGEAWVGSAEGNASQTGLPSGGIPSGTPSVVVSDQLLSGLMDGAMHSGAGGAGSAVDGGGGGETVSGAVDGPSPSTHGGAPGGKRNENTDEDEFAWFFNDR